MPILPIKVSAKYAIGLGLTLAALLVIILIVFAPVEPNGSKATKTDGLAVNFPNDYFVGKTKDYSALFDRKEPDLQVSYLRSERGWDTENRYVPFISFFVFRPGDTFYAESPNAFNEILVSKSHGYIPQLQILKGYKTVQYGRNQWQEFKPQDSPINQQTGARVLAIFSPDKVVAVDQLTLSRFTDGTQKLVEQQILSSFKLNKEVQSSSKPSTKKYIDKRYGWSITPDKTDLSQDINEYELGGDTDYPDATTFYSVKHCVKKFHVQVVDNPNRLSGEKWLASGQYLNPLLFSGKSEFIIDGALQALKTSYATYEQGVLASGKYDPVTATYYVLAHDAYVYLFFYQSPTSPPDNLVTDCQKNREALERTVKSLIVDQPPKSLPDLQTLADRRKNRLKTFGSIDIPNNPVSGTALVNRINIYADRRIANQRSQLVTYTDANGWSIQYDPLKYLLARYQQTQPLTEESCIKHFYVEVNQNPKSLSFEDWYRQSDLDPSLLKLTPELMTVNGQKTYRYTDTRSTEVHSILKHSNDDTPTLKSIRYTHYFIPFGMKIFWLSYSNSGYWDFPSSECQADEAAINRLIMTFKPSI